MPVRKSKNYISMVKKSLLSVVVILLMAGSIALSMHNNKQIYNQFYTMIDSQIDIIDFSIKLESINNRLSLGYMYQRFDQLEGISESIEEARQFNELLKMGTIEASRSVVDYYNMVETYLDECSQLAVLIDQTKNEIRQIGIYPQSEALLTQFETVQYIISYINISFKSVFSEEVTRIRSIEVEISHQHKRIYTVIILLLALASLISFFYVKSIFKTAMQLKTMTGFASQIRNNPYSKEEIEIQSNDELALFALAFDEMIRTIQKQMVEIEDNAQIRERLKNAEIERLEMNGALQTSHLQLLQSRINPHFLFNTLNMIKSTAASEGATASYDLIETTSALLHYNLTKLSTPVLVSEEIESVRNYISLQEKRFGNRISYILNIDSINIEQFIPAIILQPLVENAITHGLKDVSRGGKIIISVKMEENRLILIIIDNGEGFDDKKKQQILRECQSKNIISHIGLRNVYQRLFYFFQGDIDIILESNQEETRIGFSLPVKGSL